MIIDGHAHISTTDYGNVEILLEQMDEAQIDKAVIVPGGMLDVRRMTEYIIGREKPITTPVPNDVVKSAIEKYPDKFYGFVCVNPHDGNKAIEILEKAINEGAVGLKLAPMVHQFSFSSNTVLELANRCGELEIPFYTHVVYSPAASTTKLGMLIRKFPKTNFILGHMGFGPGDIEAVNLAYEYDNLFLETSGGSFLIIKEALQRIGADKIIFGSEFPMYHPLSELEKVKLLKNDRLDKILGGNILNLIKR